MICVKREKIKSIWKQPSIILGLPEADGTEHRSTIATNQDLIVALMRIIMQI